MSEINERSKRIRLERKVSALEAALKKCQAERDELDAAFTSLSKLVYENQPHLLRLAAQDKQE